MAEAASSARSTPAPTVRFRSVVDSVGGGTGSGLRRSPWQSRLHTPFQKTPGSRRLRSVARPSRLARSPAADSEVQKPSLKGMINQTWRVYRVSPLFRISHTEAALKQYKRHLSIHLEAEQRKGMGVSIETERADQTVVSIFEGLASENEPEAIQFILKQKASNGVAEKVVLTAVLCSCQVPDETRQSLEADFTLMPLLLVKGAVTLTRHLTSWLQMQFDCHVSPLVFSPVSLSWMVAMWAGVTKEGGRSKPVQLVYKVPDEVEGMDHIFLDIDAQDCQQLWDCIHDKEEEEFHYEKVETFISSLEAHFYYYFNISLKAMSLCRIGTASAYIGSDGRIKMFIEDQVDKILAHLTELSLECSLRVNN